ncbi:Crp/Fnr family transcriptional regulator [Bradyrhizobium betae]|uniref:Crp/Fnr family transcriptional regulator n=1 Tax=Bradyrhizobium betae TaxID=244734 RepID=A0A4Q1UV76_9BRAD|nr:Crp/Fnr family transcriptional regulator [Bradyrhizobium betae]RXT42901.1 Crp/Fnr family transcriptional regulator [Bradyrhizobium betae]
MADLITRPFNGLLRYLKQADYELLAPSLVVVESMAGETLYHPGDLIDLVYFPCGPTLVSLAVAVEEDREVATGLVGCEGAVGGVISGGLLPAYTRFVVRVGGPLARLPIRRLNEAKHQSAELRRLFERYADFFVAHQSQSVGCNAAHSNEQRAAKWILQIIEHTGVEHVALTHEELAGLLGIGRSYLTRIIQILKSEGILDTARGEIRIRDRAALQNRSCRCNHWLDKHYAEVLS